MCVENFNIMRPVTSNIAKAYDNAILPMQHPKSKVFVVSR